MFKQSTGVLIFVLAFVTKFLVWEGEWPRDRRKWGRLCDPSYYQPKLQHCVTWKRVLKAC